MKMPEAAPDWTKQFTKNNPQILSYTQRDDIIDLIKKVNERYSHWEKVKYFSMPKDITAEVFWALVKFNRIGQIKKIKLLTDINHNIFGYWLPEFVQRDLHFIDKNSGGQILTDSPNIEAERDRYLINSLMEEAIASSILEGAASTREQAKAMLRASEKPETKSDQMILNNYTTMRNLKKHINKPLTPELIKEIQASITIDTLENPNASGRFKKAGEKNYVVDNENQILFTPPPAEEIDNRIKFLCDFANDDKEFIHPAIKAIILHFWLAYIHPFVDGNGRTARSLFYWYMLKQEYWLIEFLSISRILLKAPTQYAKAYLYSELDDCDVTYFIRYHLHAICLAIKELKEYLKIQQKKIEQTSQLLRKYPGLNHRQRDIVSRGLSHPRERYTIEYYKNRQRVVYQTARYDLFQLVEKGLLEKIKEGRKFYFILSKKIHEKLKTK